VRAEPETAIRGRFDCGGGTGHEQHAPHSHQTSISRRLSPED
jgi:hypothetical protein